MSNRKEINEIEQTISDIQCEKTRQLVYTFFQYEQSHKTEDVLVGSQKFAYINAFRSIKDIEIDSISFNEVIDLLTQKRYIATILYKFFSMVFYNGASKAFQDDYYTYRFLEGSARYCSLERFKTGEWDPTHVMYADFRRDNGRIIYYSNYLPVATQYIAMLLGDFMQNRWDRENYEMQPAMAKFLYEHRVNDIHDCINDQLIEEFFSTVSYTHADSYSGAKLFFIWALEQMSQEERDERCKLYGMRTLNHTYFSKWFSSGYRPVIYNRAADVPAVDDWMLILPEGTSVSTIMTNGSILSFNFSAVKNKSFRTAVKRYCWRSSQDITTKQKDLRYLIDFFNMYYPDENSIYRRITINILSSYKSYIMSHYSNTTTRSHRVSPVSSFCNYCISNHILDIGKESLKFLRMPNGQKETDTKHVDRDELIMLANYMDEHKYDSPTSTAAYAVFHIALNTEFRISQIVNLDVGCVHEAMKKNEYEIHSITKVSHGSVVTQPCARMIKGLIEDYLTLSADLREQCVNMTEKSKIFITPGKLRGTIRIMSAITFNTYLNNACDEVGIAHYSATNLRSTYLTNAEKYVREKSLSNATLLGLSGHKNINTLKRHYIQENIEEALQAANNIIIGDISLSGQILAVENEPSSKANNVDGECGFCMSEECDSNGILNCLLCKFFATTIIRIPFFEQRLKALDDALESCETPHDKEDLNNLKRLYAAYLEELLTIKEVTNDRKPS